jgi:hypothetical protein
VAADRPEGRITSAAGALGAETTETTETIRHEFDIILKRRGSILMTYARVESGVSPFPPDAAPALSLSNP